MLGIQQSKNPGLWLTRRIKCKVVHAGCLLPATRVAVIGQGWYPGKPTHDRPVPDFYGESCFATVTAATRGCTPGDASESTCPSVGFGLTGLL